LRRQQPGLGHPCCAGNSLTWGSYLASDSSLAWGSHLASKNSLAWGSYLASDSSLAWGTAPNSAYRQQSGSLDKYLPAAPRLPQHSPYAALAALSMHGQGSLEHKLA
jgi:hypothetical protein